MRNGGGARMRNLGATNRGTKARKTSRVSRVSEIPFPAFWGEILQNSEDYKTSYKIHKRQYISGLWIYIVFFHSNFHINYNILSKNWRAFWQYLHFTYLHSYHSQSYVYLGRWADIGSSHNEQINILLNNVTHSPNFSPRIWMNWKIVLGLNSPHDAATVEKSKYIKYRIRSSISSEGEMRVNLKICCFEKRTMEGAFIENFK